MCLEMRLTLVNRTHNTVVLKLWVATPLEVAYQILQEQDYSYEVETK